MSEVVLASPTTAPDEPEHPRRRVLRIAVWLVAILVLLGALQLAGVDIWGWLGDLWDAVTEISLGYVILGCLFQGAHGL